MSHFMQSGDVYIPSPGNDSIHDRLPTGNYIIQETMAGLVLKRVDPFAEAGKMYGDVHPRAQRILTTFLDRPRSTGVLLSGEKGSGKSLLARTLTREAYEKDVPTIIINAPFHGDAFNTLLASVAQPAIVLMDEFDKVYADHRTQEQVLTLMDGAMTTQKLFVLTANDRYAVNRHMMDRPGRIFYHLEYAGLDTAFIREYCQDNLHESQQGEVESILKVSALFSAFNFDMLKALVEEINRYGETAFDALKWLNIKPFETSRTSSGFDVHAISPEGHISSIREVPNLPMKEIGGTSAFYLQFPEVSDQEWREEHLDDDDEKRFIVDLSHVKKMDVETGHCEFEVDGFQVFFNRKQHKAMSLETTLGGF